MKNLGKYLLASVIILAAATLTAYTKDGRYFTGALWLVGVLGVLAILND